MNKPWFAAKRFGIGLSPASWEGWAATYALVLLIAGAVIALRGQRPLLALALGVLIAAFIVLTLVKSDRKPWRWRWGERDEP